MCCLTIILSTCDHWTMKGPCSGGLFILGPAHFPLGTDCFFMYCRLLNQPRSLSWVLRALGGGVRLARIEWQADAKLMWHSCFCWARKSRSRLLGESVELVYRWKQKYPHAWLPFLPSLFRYLLILLYFPVFYLSDIGAKETHHNTWTSLIGGQLQLMALFL